MAQGRFGPNEWLVDEIYQQYLADRESVDPAWWDFFADYTPADGSALKAQLGSSRWHRQHHVTLCRPVLVEPLQHQQHLEALRD